MRVFKVIVYIEAETLQQAVDSVGNMLNGCYPPGEVVYPVESLMRQRKSNKPAKVYVG